MPTVLGATTRSIVVICHADFLHCPLSLMLQLMPITPAAELRDNGTWVEEMLPYFVQSCYNDAGECTITALPVSIVCTVRLRHNHCSTRR